MSEIRAESDQSDNAADRLEAIAGSMGIGGLSGISFCAPSSPRPNAASTRRARQFGGTSNID